MKGEHPPPLLRRPGRHGRQGRFVLVRGHKHAHLPMGFIKPHCRDDIVLMHRRSDPPTIQKGTRIHNGPRSLHHFLPLLRRVPRHRPLLKQGIVQLQLRVKLPPKRLKIQCQPSSKRGFQLSVCLVLHLVEQAADTHSLPWCGFRARERDQVHLCDGLGSK